MREFTPTEEEILNKLLAASSGLPVRLEQFLGAAFFSEQDGRALILQPAGRFGYFYVKTYVYEDEQARNAETARLVELMMLLVYLREQGFLVVHGGVSDSNRQMVFVSGMFRDPKPSTAHIVLNDRGDYTFVPMAICDKDDNVTHKGVRLESDLYDLVSQNASGLLYVSPALKSLLPPPPAPEPSFAQRVARWWPVPAAVMCAAAWVVYDRTDLDVRLASNGRDALSALHRIFTRADPSPHVAAASSTPIPTPVAAVKHAVVEPASATVDDEQTEHYGVDLSRWNADLLEPALDAKSIDFVFVRATSGRAKDIDFDRNWTVLQRRDAIRGAYHFYLVDDDPVAQVDYYLSVVGDSEPLEMAPAVDFEELSFPPRATPPDVATVQSGLLSALAHIEARTQRVPILYTNVSIANKYMTDPRFSRYPLWIADWTTRSEPTLPDAWKEVGYRFWQRSSQYSLQVTGNEAVDYDVFKGRRTDIYR